MVKLSVIIINYNTPEMTELSIRRLREREPELPLEIILIDNNSDEKLSAETIGSLGLKYIENRENFGFAKAVNQGIGASAGEYILLLNSDVIVDEGAISRLAGCLDGNRNTAAAGPKMVYPDGREQVSFGFFPNVLREFIRLFALYKIIPYGTLARRNRFNRRIFEEGGAVDWLSGGCLLVRRETFDRVGLLDEHYFFGVEDIDFCWRLRAAGLEVRFVPEARVVHHHGFSSGGPRTIKKMEMERDNLNYFMKKNYPERVASRAVIYVMHSLKILLIKGILNFKL